MIVIKCSVGIEPNAGIPMLKIFAKYSGRKGNALKKTVHQDIHITANILGEGANEVMNVFIFTRKRMTVSLKVKLCPIRMFMKTMIIWSLTKILTFLKRKKMK